MILITFILEYVQGTSKREFANENNLGTPEICKLKPDVIVEIKHTYLILEMIIIVNRFLQMTNSNSSFFNGNSLLNIRGGA